MLLFVIKHKRFNNDTCYLYTIQHRKSVNAVNDVNDRHILLKDGILNKGIHTI